MSILAIIMIAIAVVAMKSNRGGTQKKFIKIYPVAEEYGPLSEGFQVSANLESESEGSGVSLLLKLSIKNVTTGILSFPSNYPERDYEVIVTNEKGVRAPLTTFGKRLQEPEESRLVEVKVKAGEEVKDQISLNKIYDLSANGTYSLTAKRKVFKRNGKGIAEVVSNTVKFTISS